MPPIEFDEATADQEKLMAAAEFSEDNSDGKTGIVYEEFKLDAPDHNLLTPEEIASLADDGSAPDMWDDAAEDLPVDDGVTGIAQQPPVTAPAVAPVDYQAALTKADADIAALRSLLADGEIGEEEFGDQLETLAEQRGELRSAAKAQTAMLEQKEATEAAQFSDAVKGFKSSHAHLFAPDHFDKFNVDVQSVTGDPRYAGLSFEKQLQKAAIDYAFKAANPALANPTKARVTPAPAPKAKAQVQERMKPVPTLARVPAAAATPVDGGKYAALDAVVDSRNPMAAEAALSRMTKQQMEDYGAGR